MSRGWHFVLALSAVAALCISGSFKTVDGAGTGLHLGKRGRSVGGAQSALGPRMSLSQGEAVAKLMNIRARLVLRGGGDSVIHEESWGVKDGMSVHTKVERRGNKVFTNFWISGGNGGSNVSLRWGLAMNSVDEWLTPRDAGPVAEKVSPPGSVDVPGGKRTRFKDGSLCFESPADGDGRPLGVRFVIEMDEGVPYPQGGGTLFSPTREGVDLSYVVKPDYGSLEERLNKRTNLPEHLQGDEGREQHLHENRHAIHGPCGQLELDIGKHLNLVNLFVDVHLCMP